MKPSAAAVDAAIRQSETARSRVSRLRNRQVKSADDRDYLRSVAYTWFHSHRPIVVDDAGAELLASVDATYHVVLDASERLSARRTYLTAFDEVRTALLSLRSSLLSVSLPSSPPPTPEQPPDFSPLAADSEMRVILVRRWNECLVCIRAGAHLAATVMMGGLLEALFVARANRMKDKSLLFKAKATPIDSKTGKPLDLRDWTLRPYIDVGHELNWITRSGKDVAAVLRDYRNYVHPEKERAHGVVLAEHDSQMFWEVTKALVRQLLGVS
jgi:hypothetical protein